MKRLLAYLFIVLGLGLTFNVNSNGKEIDKEFYKFKKILIPLSNDGSWKLIGKKIQHIHSARLTWIYLAQTKNDQLSKLIELVHVTVASENVSESLIWAKNFVYQINGFNSCIPKSSSGKSATLVEKYYVYEEPEKSTGCFFTRNMDIKREIFYPSIKRKTDYVDTNHFPKIIKKYLNNEENLPKIMLRSDHYFTSQTELYGYFEMINPDVNGAPNTLFASEKKSEYHPLNIDNHPQKKNFYLTWIKSQAKKHLKFETELKRKYKIDLAKYINFEPIKDLKNSPEITIIAEKESKITTKKKVKVAKVEEQKKEEFKPKKIIKSSEVNFYKIKQGDNIDNPIISISKKNKIALPKGNWQVAKKTRVNGWRYTDVMILVNQSSSDNSSFGEFIEISVTSILEKKELTGGMYMANQELREPCKKKNYFHDLQKTSGSGNSFSCFATGLAKNDIFKTPLNNFNPWNYKFRDYFSEKETLTDNILFSLSAYSGGTRTKSRLISVIYGSSLNSISDKNKIDFENEELIKNIWTKKTIDFHNNFQNNMNFKESHLINLDSEYQDLENKYADLINVDKTKKTVKKEIKIITKKKKVKVAKVEEQKKEEFKSKKIIKSSEVNFYKINQGDIIDNPIISISKKKKIALPKGNWQVAKKTRVTGWRYTDVMILVNQSSFDNSSFGEFIEISATQYAHKNMDNANAAIREPCKKKNYFHDLQKTSGSGYSFSCFATGFAKNNIFKTPYNRYNPWSYKFRDYFSDKGTLPKNILFSLSAYLRGTGTKSELISVIYGSSLNSISDKNKIDFENEELLKNIWTKKTIDFHNNFQKNMNFKESHLINLDAEYQDLENKYADLIKTVDQKQKVKKIIKKEKKAKKKLVVDKEISEEQKKIADKKAKAEKKKKLAQKKIEEEEKKLVEKKAKEEAENQKILSSKNIDTEITNDENSADNKNFLETLAKKEVLEPNKKKIIRYECQQPWDLTTEDYRPLLDIYELDLEDRVLIGTHRYITDKEYTEERTYPILAKDKNRVLVRYDSPNGNFTTKFFFNYGTDQSIVAADNSYKTQAKCVNRDYFVDIKFAKKKVDNLELSKKDLKALEEAKNEALLAEKEIKEIEKEQEELLAKQEKILKKQKQGTETTKVAKLKIYEDPKKLNKSFSSSISKSNFKKYKATSTVSYLFFESSENYLISLELLYRAYDLNTEAEKIRSHLSYMKESKSSENQRLKSTRQIVQEQTVTISNNIKNESIALTEQGKVYYAQALPYALNASIATYNLFHVAKNTINNVGNQGDVVFGILNNLNNVIGMVQILPQLPSYSKNMYQTTKLIITRAKTKKIKESTSTKKALDDLNLEI